MRPDAAPDTAATRLALSQQTIERLEPVDMAGARLWAGPSGHDELVALQRAWRAAVVALRQDPFPQAGAGLLFECLQAFQAVEAGAAVSPTVSRLRGCRARAAFMASAARQDAVAMAYIRVELYAAAGLRALGAREAARGSRDAGSALQREGSTPAADEIGDP